MIIGSLSTRAVSIQDIGVNPVASGSVASVASQAGTTAAAAPTAAETANTAAAAGYISPFGRFDYTSHLEILQFRNSDTGKVTLQIPSERVVDAYRRSGAVSGQQQQHQTPVTQVTANTGYPVPGATTVPRAPSVDYAVAPASDNQQSTGGAAVAAPATGTTGSGAVATASAPAEVATNAGTPAATVAIAVSAPVAEPKPATGGGSAA